MTVLISFAINCKQLLTEMAVDTLQIRFAPLLAEYTASQQRLKQRLTAVEQRSSSLDDSSLAAPPDSSAVAAVGSANSMRSMSLSMTSKTCRHLAVITFFSNPGAL